MKWSKTASLVATLAYADIFDYPLSLRDICYWCIKCCLKQSEAFNILFRLTGVHLTRGNSKTAVFYLSGRDKTVTIRRFRNTSNQLKWEKARKASMWLKVIPTISLVGVTGGLAMNNAKLQDDIDILLVVKSGSLWTTRFLATLLIELVARRRRPEESEISDSICLNMFMTEDALGIPNTEQDLYGAHEVLQMVPLWEREGTYHRFLQANSWVKQFLPNAWEEKWTIYNVQCTNKRLSFFQIFLRFTLYILYTVEPLAKRIQLWYMGRHRTTERISDSALMFHPHDARIWVRYALRKRLLSYKIPLDKVFTAL
jgi:hypothetical protein